MRTYVKLDYNRFHMPVRFKKKKKESIHICRLTVIYALRKEKQLENY